MSAEQPRQSGQEPVDKRRRALVAASVAGGGLAAAGGLVELINVLSRSEPQTAFTPHRTLSPGPSESTETSANSQLLRVENGRIMRGDTPVGIFGANCYPAISDGSVCGPGMNNAQRAQEFRTANQLGMNAIRYWDLAAINANGTDRAATNQLLELAATQNILLYPVLLNQWADCEGNANSPSINPNFYQQVVTDFYNYRRGHQLDPNGYLKYIQGQALEFKENPHVFAFQLGNELESSDPSLLRNFSIAARTIIKQMDPTRLVTVGVLGSGQPGTDNDNFRQLMETCDFVDFHIYPQNGTTNRLPGDAWNGVAVRMQQAAALNKPVVVSEFGIPAGATDVTSYRNTLMTLMTYRNFVGVFPWGLNTPGFDHSDGYQFGPDSDVMHMYQQNGLADRLKNPSLRPRK